MRPFRRGPLMGPERTTYAPETGGVWGNGLTPTQVLERFPVETQDQPIAPTAQQTAMLKPAAGLQQELPKPPPTKRSNNPFAKDNLGQTLLDIGQGFLSSPDFAQGLGNAAGAISGRAADLRKLNTPKVSYGGPQDQFEITENPDGTRAYRQIPEVAEAIASANKAKSAPSAKELVDMRARTIRSIMELPPEQRANAYAMVMTFPERYGLDVTNMPRAWDETYGSVVSGMGLSANQAEGLDLRREQLAHRKDVDATRSSQNAQRIGQAERRLKRPPASVMRTPNYGSDLDY
jgi:hypothetical protein